MQLRSVRLLLLFLLPILPRIATAQGMDRPTEVRFGSISFSSGIHPTLTVVFENTTTRVVEGHWKDILKPVSAHVSSKKEVIAEAALLPNISSDTVRVLVKADQYKRSTSITAHVAILTTNGFVGPQSDAITVEACKRFVLDRSVALKREILAKELEEEEKDLRSMERDMDLLQREKERAETNIVRTQRKKEDALQDQDEYARQLDILDAKVKAAEALAAEEPTEENRDELADLVKTQRKLQGRLDHAHEMEADCIKKVEDLEWSIRKNQEDQEIKTRAIEEQRKVVARMQERLRNVR